MRNLLIPVLAICLIACHSKRDSRDEQLFVGDIRFIASVDPLKFFDRTDPELLLSLPMTRDWLSSSSFEGAWHALFEDPLSSGFNFRKSFYIVGSQWDGKPCMYGFWHLNSEKKTEAFFQRLGFQNIRTYRNYKVVVAEPYAIAWDKSYALLVPAQLLPELLDAIAQNNTVSNPAASFMKHTDPLALISVLVRPDWLPVWKENVDRLRLCGLEIDEIENQYLTLDLYERKQAMSIDVRFHYSDSWASFWKTFFNQTATKVQKTDTTHLQGSLITSRLNLTRVDSILQTNCPVDLLEPYLSIPSHDIAKHIYSCLDEQYAIYLPSQERYPENHLMLFRVLYPTHLSNILAEELALQLGSHEVLSDTLAWKQERHALYYAMRDSLLIVSKNALNIVKSEEILPILQQHMQRQPYQQGGFYISAAHLHQVLGAGSDQLLTSEIQGNIMDNRLWLQLGKTESDKNSLVSILRLINHLYEYNKQFYEWWETPESDIEI